MTTATTGVAGRYASALFELADGSKSLDQVAQDLATFRKMVAESTDLARLIASPVIPRDIRDAIANDVSADETAFVARDWVNRF